MARVSLTALSPEEKKCYGRYEKSFALVDLSYLWQGGKRLCKALKHFIVSWRKNFMKPSKNPRPVGRTLSSIGSDIDENGADPRQDSFRSSRTGSFLDREPVFDSGASSDSVSEYAPEKVARQPVSVVWQKITIVCFSFSKCLALSIKELQIFPEGTLLMHLIPGRDVWFPIHV